MSSWHFTRQLGIGEREHVRTQILGIGFFHPANIVEQIRGAMRAANSLGMRLRVHLNADQQTPEAMKQVEALMRDHVSHDHDLEPWTKLDRQRFDSMCKKLEIMVTRGRLNSDEDVELLVYLGVLEAWAQSGGRFLQGNHANRTDETLRYMYPQFYHSTDKYWELWSA
jgi:hypothetical protein